MGVDILDSFADIVWGTVGRKDSANWPRHLRAAGDDFDALFAREPRADHAGCTVADPRTVRYARRGRQSPSHFGGIICRAVVGGFALANKPFMADLLLYDMSEEHRRLRLTKDLRQVLGEVAALSDEIAALRATRYSDSKMRELEVQWAAANARANELRKEVAAHDDSQKTPIPR